MPASCANLIRQIWDVLYETGVARIARVLQRDVCMHCYKIEKGAFKPLFMEEHSPDYARIRGAATGFGSGFQYGSV